MKMKIAVPVDDSGTLDSHFGHCRYFSIYQTQDGKILSDETLQPPPHEPGILPAWLAEQGVTHVLAGGMGQRAIKLFKHQNIHVHTGAPLMPANELVGGFLENQVQFNSNHCDH